MARWRDRFLETGVDGVGVIAPGRGRKPEIGQDVIEAIVDDTLHTVPDDGSTRWSTRSMAARHGVGKDTVARIWRARNLRPWQVDTFKMSNDPDFEEKLVDVVGLYLEPTGAGGGVLLRREDPGQALDRTQPSLPIKPGRGETMTHDYKRNGTIDLFAAMNVGTGEVLHQHPQVAHRRPTCWRSSNGSICTRRRDLEIHVVLDNLSAHKSPAGRASGSPTRNGPAGICTSRRHRRRG